MTPAATSSAHPATTAAPALSRAAAAVGRWLSATVSLIACPPMTQDRAAAPAAAEARAQIAAGMRERFQGLMLPHLDAAYSLARYLSRDPDAAEDIVQDAYVKAWRGFDGFRGGDARAWILAIVRNGVRDWHEQQRRERSRRTDPAPIPDSHDGDDAPDPIAAIASDLETAEAALIRRDDADLIRSVIERLPEPLKEVLVLREIEDLSYRQIAELTAVPLGTVMSRLARARDAFAAIWHRLEPGRRAQP